MHVGIVIPSDETKEPFEHSFNGLEDHQKVVGGYIEPVRLDQAKLTIYCNEEGKLRSLPFNRRATALWWLLDPIAREVDELVGDIVIIGASHGQRTTTDVPADLRHLVVHATGLRSEIRIFERLGWHRTELEFTNYFDAAIHALLYFRSDDAVTSNAEHRYSTPTLRCSASQPSYSQWHATKLAANYSKRFTPSCSSTSMPQLEATCET